VSARNLINAALGIASNALAIEIPAADDEPGVARIEGLLHALVTAQLATAEAVLEGQHGGRLADLEVEHAQVPLSILARALVDKPHGDEGRPLSPSPDH
jgi:hypothetical protein